MERVLTWCGSMLLILHIWLQFPFAYADFPNHSSSELLPPVLTILKRPKANYRLDDIITYRIQVRWTESYLDLRMRPPDVELFNLKLLGVSEETVSGPEHGTATNQSQQILNFNFQALAPGPARMEQISLKWTRAHGEMSSKLRVPGFDVTIKRVPPPWPLIVSVGAAIVGICFVTLKRLRHKPAPPLPPHPVRSFGEEQLELLGQSYSNWKGSGHNQIFLDAIHEIAACYLAQELDWHFGRDSYNELAMKAKAKWSGKDAALVGDFVKKLEYQRFSGTATDPSELERMYHNLYAFIDGKRVMSIE